MREFFLPGISNSWHRQLCLPRIYRWGRTLHRSVFMASIKETIIVLLSYPPLGAGGKSG
ncbi:MAG: hypothetical protein IPM85_08060 [Chitinophagaceae bacterium]|nr:hypothetical protein [Chitinophagaceae bacterium]